MKRIFSFFLAGILLLSFSACSSETSGSDQVSSTESSTVQPPETDSDATQSSSNTMEQETVSPNSDMLRRVILFQRCLLYKPYT